MGGAVGWLRRAWRWLGQTRLARWLLTCTLAATTVGSLFPQVPTGPEAAGLWWEAVALRYGRATALYRGVGLFQWARAPWFLALVGLLLLNLLACTLQRLPRAISHATQGRWHTASSEVGHLAAWFWILALVGAPLHRGTAYLLAVVAGALFLATTTIALWGREQGEGVPGETGDG